MQVSVRPLNLNLMSSFHFSIHQVNNTHVLGVKYEQATALETVYDKFNNALLKISYAQTGLPMSWQVGNLLSPVMVKYDR